MKQARYRKPGCIAQKKKKRVGGGGGAIVCRDCGVCAVTYSPKPRFRLGYLVDLSS